MDKRTNGVNLICKDKELSNKIINDLNAFKPVAMNFFGIQNLSRNFNIKIYDNLENFINFVTFDGEQPRRYHIGTVATARDGFAHILSPELYLKDAHHTNCTYDDYIKTLKHEFVHVCHEEILKDKNIMPPLLMEGIATRLAGQTKYANKVNKIECSAEDLICNFYSTKKSYAYAYEIMGYLINNTSHENLLNLLSEPQKANVKKLIEDTNIFLKKYNKTTENEMHN